MSSFSIKDHILMGQANGMDVKQLPSQNYSREISPTFLVFHYTACDATTAANAFISPTSSKSVHLMVDLDGSVTQFVALNSRAWHAGVSQWNGYQDINSHSIGIEVVNYGYLLKTAAGVFRTADGKLEIKSEDIIESRHKLPSCTYIYWNAFSIAQIETCTELAQLLTSAYGLEDIVGHDDIAPSRKVDPGPAFPISRIRSLALGRNSPIAEEDSVYVSVDKLNIRKAADPTFELAAPPLIRNTQLVVLDRRVTDWLRVRVMQNPPVEGWVRMIYTSSKVT